MNQFKNIHMVKQLQSQIKNFQILKSRVINILAHKIESRTMTRTIPSLIRIIPRKQTTKVSTNRFNSKNITETYPYKYQLFDY